MNERDEVLSGIVRVIETIVKSLKESNSNVLDILKMTRDVLTNLDARVRVLEKKVNDETTH